MEITKENWERLKMYIDEIYSKLSLKNKKLLNEDFGVDCVTDILNDCGILYFDEDFSLDLKEVRDLTGK